MSAAPVLIGAHVLSMLGFATFAALLPELRDLWGLSNAGAGLIASAFFAGYALSVSYWTTLTDRTDGRRVYLAGSLLALAGCAGFGLAAQGMASAVLFQALLGAGVAGTYMPGLRLLSDRVGGPSQSRFISFYTSFFGIGTALSFALAGILAAAYGWRTAFVVSAGGPLCAGLAVFLLLEKSKTAPAHWAVVLALLTVYALLVMADSGTLTAGLVAAVPLELRGAALGLYSLAGFAGGMLGPALFGAALDLGGGQAGAAGWVWAHAAIGAGCLAAPLVARLFARARGQ